MYIIVYITYQGVWVLTKKKSRGHWVYYRDALCFGIDQSISIIRNSSESIAIHDHFPLASPADQNLLFFFFDILASLVNGHGINLSISNDGH